MRLSTSPLSILKKLIFLIGLLFIGNVIAAILKKINLENELLHGLGVLLDFDREANIPTFFSALILLSCSLLLVYIYRISNMHKIHRTYWLLLSLIFAFLAIDEFAVIHEKLIDILRPEYNATGYMYYTWVLPYGIAVIIFGIFSIPFLTKLPFEIRKLFMYSAFLFLFGALGMEMLGGQQAEKFGIYTLTYIFFYSVEELCEMLGISLFIYALLTYIVKYIGLNSLTIKMKASADKADSKAINLLSKV